MPREGTSLAADERGIFEITLNPGTYLLVPQPGENGVPVAENQVVEVSPDAFIEVTLLYDTGIPGAAIQDQRHGAMTAESS